MRFWVWLVEHDFGPNNGGFPGVAAGAIDNVSVEQARKMLLSRYFTLTYAPTCQTAPI